MTPGARKQASRRDGLSRGNWHPIQLAILAVLDRREASPTELAEELGVNFQRVAYHVRRLRDKGRIELVGTDRRRGGTQHFYRSAGRLVVDMAEAAEQSREIREQLSAVVVPRIVGDLQRALAAGTMDDHEQRTLVRLPMVLDAEGYVEAAIANAEHLERLQQIQARSTERRAQSGEPGINTAASVTTFPLPIDSHKQLLKTTSSSNDSTGWFDRQPKVSQNPPRPDEAY